jgi:glycogen synthase kinase 3 beta
MIKKLGTPTEEEVTAMNPDYQNKQLPRVEGLGWAKIFPGTKHLDAVDLVSKMLVYDPTKRLGLYKAMCHKLFDELRQEDLILPNGNCIPDLFSFTAKEKEDMGPECRDVLIPSWYDPVTSPGYH